MRDKIINLHSSVANSKDILKKALINNTSNPEQNMLQGEIAVINTPGSEGIYTINNDGTDIIEFKPLSKEEKDQLTNLILAGVKDEIYIGAEAPTGNETVWIDTDENPTYSDIAVTEAPKDGKQYARQDGAWNVVEAGDKTNVLIINYETDLANGKTGSTVTPEVSASLLDAIEKGKACVVKSGDSDILSNLQKIGNNVQIIMEQVSSFEGTFLATNTIISVNTTANTISNLSTGAIELVDRQNVLTKTNTTEFTPDADYEPATKKYADNSNILVKTYNSSHEVNGITFTINVYSNNANNIMSSQSITDTQSILVNAEVSVSGNKIASFACGYENSLVPTNKNEHTFAYNNDIYSIDINDLTDIKMRCIQRILTETEYTALGDATDNDNILYFVTPDA